MIKLYSKINCGLGPAMFFCRCSVIGLGGGSYSDSNLINYSCGFGHLEHDNHCHDSLA